MTYDELKRKHVRLSEEFANTEVKLDNLGKELQTIRREILHTEQSMRRSQERISAYNAYRNERDCYQKKYRELYNIDEEAAWVWYCCIVDKLKAKLNKNLADIDAKYDVKT